LANIEADFNKKIAQKVNNKPENDEEQPTPGGKPALQ
jgi:hypothetical protein